MPQVVACAFSMPLATSYALKYVDKASENVNNVYNQHVNSLMQISLQSTPIKRKCEAELFSHDSLLTSVSQIFFFKDLIVRVMEVSVWSMHYRYLNFKAIFSIMKFKNTNFVE